MPSIKEVAERAGVSVTTVSLVLNNKGNISQRTRDHVMDVVQAMGYTRSIQARNLREQQSRIIGYAQFKERGQFNPLLDRFLFELVQLIEDTGRHLLLFNTDNEDLVGPYHELIRSQRVDGFVLSYTERGDPRFESLHGAGVPFVAFGRSATALDEITHWVDVDGHRGIYDATQHLIDCGHSKIAFAGWPEGSASGDSRFNGYYDALHVNGIPIEASYMLRTENFVSEGYICGQALMDLPDPPTALVTVSDVLAIGAMRYFTMSGCRIAVTGFDDTPTAAFMFPSLTSVHQPVDQVASVLVDMLLKQLNGIPVDIKQHVLQPSLIIRASSTLDY